MEVKLLIGALGGPHELLGGPKDPPRGPKWLKMTQRVKNRKKMSESIIKVRFLADSTVMGRTWELDSIWGP